jgi:hypothetical protein
MRLESETTPLLSPPVEEDHGHDHLPGGGPAVGIVGAPYRGLRRPLFPHKPVVREEDYQDPPLLEKEKFQLIEQCKGYRFFDPYLDIIMAVRNNYLV